MINDEEDSMHGNNQEFYRTQYYFCFKFKRGYIMVKVFIFLVKQLQAIHSSSTP
jgi:hypothetical protein